MNQTRKFPTFAIGTTSSNKKVNVPSTIRDMHRYMRRVKKTLTFEELFELHAMLEYLFSREKRKYGDLSNFVEIFSSASNFVRQHLESHNVLNMIMKKRNISNLFDILKLGKSLVLTEYRAD